MANPTFNSTFSGSSNQGLQVGHNPGQIEAHFHQAQRPEAPPSPSCVVPFRRDPDFVDCGTLLDQIREGCSAPASRIALVGLGGVGKSQLAIEHCYRTTDRSPETWVFWVHASTAARIEQGYRDIADQVKLAGRNDPKADVFKLVHNWLRNEENGKWLLVLDNADETAALSLPASNGTRRYFSSYLSQSKNGSVLVTSRTKSVALQLVEERDIIPIKPMDDTSAQALLQKKLGEEADKDGAAELADALEFMPLALVQAAAYIRQRAARCSVQQYLEKFHKSEKEKTSLLNSDEDSLRRDKEAKNSILITWQISFDHILEERQSAADLLSLMSFFDRQGIPESLIRVRSRTRIRHWAPNATNADGEYSNSDSSESEASLDDGFEEDILMLRNYSFIGLTTDTTTFDMHRLVQLATRKWLEGQSQLEIWKEQYIDNLCTAFPNGEHENWTQCQALFPHAKSALLQPPKSKESLRRWALLLYNAAWYAWRKGSLGDAEELSIKSMKIEIKLLGKEHKDTLSSMAMVGLARSHAGRWTEAEELQVQVVETRKRVLRAEHPDMLRSIHNLASTYCNQGRWKEAEELQVQVMETRKRGRWKEAEELQMQVMEMRKRVLGAEHPDMLSSMNNLAHMWKCRGRWAEAEELQVQVIEIRKRVLGAEHPDTLTSMNNLASTYWNQGRWKEAEELEVQVVETRKRVLGAEHPDTLSSMNNLAHTWKSRGRNGEAIALMERCVQLSRQILGPQHPRTASSLRNLNKWQMENRD
ncbi:TPR-like protein [Mytilinidion resinicola]|uniref:TPR-like protein n=1 Tax=Mytilinidion resinicola TaxID=574789 RepID=A0A6A6YG32_9PEZI|nr:TPR-like protein [Mytilinidion resinicola]KAF2807493.1 TPR-like protein [Mytilinidion resinicola]